MQEYTDENPAPVDPIRNNKRIPEWNYSPHDEETQKFLDAYALDPNRDFQVEGLLDRMHNEIDGPLTNKPSIKFKPESVEEELRLLKRMAKRLLTVHDEEMEQLSSRLTAHRGTIDKLNDELTAQGIKLNLTNIQLRQSKNQVDFREKELKKQKVEIKKLQLELDDLKKGGKKRVAEDEVVDPNNLKKPKKEDGNETKTGRKQSWSDLKEFDGRYNLEWTEMKDENVLVKLRSNAKNKEVSNDISFYMSHDKTTKQKAYRAAKAPNDENYTVNYLCTGEGCYLVANSMQGLCVGCTKKKKEGR